MAIWAAIPAILQGATALYQGYKANQASKAKANFQIPEAQKQAMNLAKTMATQKSLPGQSIIEDKMRGSTASGISAIKQTGNDADTMQAMVDLFTNEQMGFRDLGIAAEEQYISKQGTLMNALGNMAEWQNKANEFNIYDPYREKMREKTMMTEGAIQNAYGAATSYVANNQAEKNYLMEKQYYDYLYGDKTKEPDYSLFQQNASQSGKFYNLSKYKQNLTNYFLNK